MGTQEHSCCWEQKPSTEVLVRVYLPPWELCPRRVGSCQHSQLPLGWALLRQDGLWFKQVLAGPNKVKAMEETRMGSPEDQGPEEGHAAVYLVQVLRKLRTSGSPPPCQHHTHPP